jgi:lipoate-protein ligase A
MKIIYNPSIDPYFNLAAEEYFMRRAEEDIFMLWRNDRSVIIGRNQNAYAEVNVEEAENRRVKIARRLTGGGAVFHDKGNVNFSFISPQSKDKSVPMADFADFVAPVIKALASFGTDAAPGGRNDILCDGAKISGCAACSLGLPGGRSATLRHGTLLFSADISEMANVLNVNRLKMESKGIASVKSRVANIASIPSYNGPREVKEFLDALLRFAEGEFGSATTLLTDEDAAGVTALRNEKYATWDWIWGENPSMSDIREKRFPFGTLNVAMNSRRGTIESIRITGDFFSEGDVSSLENALAGAPVRREELENILSSSGAENIICGCTAAQLAELIAQ